MQSISWCRCSAGWSSWGKVWFQPLIPAICIYYVCIKTANRPPKAIFRISFVTQITHTDRKICKSVYFDKFFNKDRSNTATRRMFAQWKWNSENAIPRRLIETSNSLKMFPDYRSLNYCASIHILLQDRLPNRPIAVELQWDGQPLVLKSVADYQMAKIIQLPLYWYVKTYTDSGPWC